MNTVTNKRAGAADPETIAKKQKGSMIFGLKAWIKSLEMQEGGKKSEGRYRYEVSADASTGRIVLAADGTVVPGTEKTRAEWAAIGKPARLASIGLRSRKDELEDELKERVEYTFNVVTGEAYLSKAGEVLASEPTGIAAWAAHGQPVEMKLFQQLNVAYEWNNAEAVRKTKERMIKYGIIRKQVSKDDTAAA